MSPIAARKVAAVITLTPGTVISRFASAESSAWLAITRSTPAISASRKSTWRRALSTVSRSSSGSSSSSSQRRPSRPNRSATFGFAIRRRTSVAWTSFFARVRARTSCARRPSLRRSARVASSGSHKPSSEPEANSFASARASSRSVFARAWRMPVSLGLTTSTLATCGSMMRAISQAFPVTSSATRSLLPRLCANSSSRSGVVSIRPAERSSPSSEIATSQKSRCTSSPMSLT
jgi:hypothetical protein